MAIGVAFFAIVAIIGLVFFAARFLQQRWVLDDKPGLTGTVRSGFVDSAVASCLKTQKEDEANKGISPSVISQYCDCYANGMADKLSNHDLRTVADTTTRDEAVAKFQPLAEAAGNACADAISER